MDANKRSTGVVNVKVKCMSEEITWLEKILAYVLLPATFWGAAGALTRSIKLRKSWKLWVFEMLGGVLTANMVCPLIAEYVDDKWHYTLFFLVGWGGLELIGRLYEASASALERRIQKKINPEGGE